MTTFKFSIIATGSDPERPDFEDAFFEAGCDDSTLSFQKGVIVLDFTREAADFRSAVESAMRDVARAGATVEHVEPDHLVSLADIARRTNLTRAAVTHFAQGQRGENFPNPVARVTTESPLWDWVEVSRWLHHRGTVGQEVIEQASVVRATNRAIMQQRQQAYGGQQAGRKAGDQMG